MNRNDISEIIGDYCEGCTVSEGDIDIIKSALKGFVETDHGFYRFYVDLDSICLSNIDYSEAIWYLGMDESYPGDENEIVFLDEIFHDNIIANRISENDNPELKRDCLYRKIINPLKKFNKD